MVLPFRRKEGKAFSLARGGRGMVDNLETSTSGQSGHNRDNRGKGSVEVGG